MTDIVERLRFLVPSDSSGAAFDAVNEITRLRNELHLSQEWPLRIIAEREEDCKEITALRAENKRLRAALEETLNTPRDANKTYAELFVEVCCELRAALEEKT